MTYSPMIGNGQLQSGFIDFLAALSLDPHELPLLTRVVSFAVYANSKECGEHDSSPTFIGLISHCNSWKT